MSHWSNIPYLFLWMCAEWTFWRCSVTAYPTCSYMRRKQVVVFRKLSSVRIYHFQSRKNCFYERKMSRTNFHKSVSVSERASHLNQKKTNVNISEVQNLLYIWEHRFYFLFLLSIVPKVYEQNFKEARNDSLIHRLLQMNL